MIIYLIKPRALLNFWMRMCMLCVWAVDDNQLRVMTGSWQGSYFRYLGGIENMHAPCVKLTVQWLLVPLPRPRCASAGCFQCSCKSRYAHYTSPSVPHTPCSHFVKVNHNIHRWTADCTVMCILNEKQVAIVVTRMSTVKTRLLQRGTWHMSASQNVSWLHSQQTMQGQENGQVDDGKCPRLLQNEDEMWLKQH